MSDSSRVASTLKRASSSLSQRDLGVLLDHDYLSNLPDEKLMNILELLPIESVARLCGANSRMRLLCEDRGIVDRAIVEKTMRRDRDALMTALQPDLEWVDGEFWELD